MGSDGLRRRGKIWHIDTCFRGHRIRQSCETEDRNQAVSILRQRQAEVDQRGPVALRTPKLTFGDLARDFITDYEINKKRSLGKAKKSVAHLSEYFGRYRAVNITTQDVRAYIEKRLRAGLANGTINRKLAALKRMFQLAAKGKLVSTDRIPEVPMLKEAPPRAGFFEPAQFRALLPHLRPEIQPVAKFAYETGWRLREIITLQWRQLDLIEGSVRLDPGSTKNGEGRVAYLSRELLTVLQAQHAASRKLEREHGIVIPWVFHRKGRRILRFLASWQTACRLVGLPGMLFHDLRRTAVRNMVRAGIPERVAMQISGHRTRSVFERYNITSDADLREAAKRLGAHNNGSTDRQHSAAGGPAATGSMPEGR
jgi:integrase